MTDEQRAILDFLREHLRTAADTETLCDEEIFIRAHREIIGGVDSHGCAKSDFRQFVDPNRPPRLPAYVTAAHLEAKGKS